VRWCLALGVLVVGLSGCKSWETQDEGLRHSDLSVTARQARSKSEKPDKQKEADDPWMSERAKQISRDLE
jgi:hypothetical protein